MHTLSSNSVYRHVLPVFLYKSCVNIENNKRSLLVIQTYGECISVHPEVRDDVALTWRHVFEYFLCGLWEVTKWIIYPDHEQKISPHRILFGRYRTVTSYTLDVYNARTYKFYIVCGFCACPVG